MTVPHATLIVISLALAACASAPEDGAFERGARLQASGKTRDAIDQYLKAVAESPGDGDAWFNLGVAWQQLDNDDEARAAYARAIDVEPRAADAMCNLALLSPPAEADALLARAAEAAPHRAFPWIVRARLPSTSPEERARLVAEALRREPDSAIAHLEAARLAHAANDKPLALEHAERAFELGGASPEIARALAKIALWADAPTTAVVAALRLTVLEPDHAEPYVLLARGYLAQSKDAEALWAAVTARNLEPDNPEHKALVAEVRARL